jgi:peptide/nickel transport system ATP-binding protein
VNLSVKKGEILGLVGETGSGKSVTSLSTLAMVISPGAIEGGKIELNVEGQRRDMLDMNIADLQEMRGKSIAMIFQEPRAALNPVYSVGDQIAEVYYHHRREEMIERTLSELEKELIELPRKTSDLKKERKAFRRFRLGTSYRFRKMAVRYHIPFYKRLAKNPKARTVRLAGRIPFIRRFQNPMKHLIKKEAVELLRLLRIPDPDRVVDMYPHELSGGMAQRVVIAMALTCNPMMLIADEPTTSLDVTVQAQILFLIKELKQKLGSAVLYVTHDLGVVAEVCERVAVMYGGTAVEIADVMTFFKKPMHPYARALLDSIPRPGKRFQSIPGTVPSLINPPEGCRFYDRCKYATEKCPLTKPMLVEVEKGHFVACHQYGGS